MSGGAQDGRLNNAESKISVLEVRLGYLEGRVEKNDGKAESIGERITRLEEKLAHLPTKEHVVKIVLGALAVITALILFQSKIKSFISGVSG